MRSRAQGCPPETAAVGVPAQVGNGAQSIRSASSLTTIRAWAPGRLAAPVESRVPRGADALRSELAKRKPCSRCPTMVLLVRDHVASGRPARLAALSRAVGTVADGLSAPWPRAHVLDRSRTGAGAWRRFDFAERRSGSQPLPAGVCVRDDRGFTLVRLGLDGRPGWRRTVWPLQSKRTDGFLSRGFANLAHRQLDLPLHLLAQRHSGRRLGSPWR